MIFNNQELSSLVLNKPKNKSEFISISGFGEKKYNEFGQEIINLIWEDQLDAIEQTDKKETNEDLINSPLYKALKKYRFEQSKLENIKPYMIFNNEELTSLCINKPLNKEQFIALKGFGEKKFEKYGESIINIIKNN